MTISSEQAIKNSLLLERWSVFVTKPLVGPKKLIIEKDDTLQAFSLVTDEQSAQTITTQVMPNDIPEGYKKCLEEILLGKDEEEIIQKQSYTFIIRELSSHYQFSRHVSKTLMK